MDPSQPSWPPPLAVALSLSVVSACSSPYSPATHQPGCPSGSAVTVSASPGLAPRFTWGGCDVAVLSVQPVDANGQFTGAPVWQVNGVEAGNGAVNNVIESGVRYGTKPRYATTLGGLRASRRASGIGS